VGILGKVIVADENEGRRNLLANTLEREGFEITRAGTLRQAEGTALATMPEVVLIDGEWKSGDALDASQRLMGDPEFAFKCRVVVLSRSSSQDYLVAAAKSGIAEVITKPVDMSKLIEQLWKHCKKQFVPPPADIEDGTGDKGGTFAVSVGDGTWALPALKNLVGPETINADFIDEILIQMDEEGLEVETDFDSTTLANLMRLALNKLVLEDEEEETGDVTFESIKRGDKLGGGKKLSSSPMDKITVEQMMEKQAEVIASEVEEVMDDVLDEDPERIALLESGQMELIDPNVLNMTRLVSELVSDLLWELGQRGALEDLTLTTRVEDCAQMMVDVLSSLPEKSEEE